jgi:hypothetical protein
MVRWPRTGRHWMCRMPRRHPMSTCRVCLCGWKRERERERRRKSEYVYTDGTRHGHARTHTRHLGEGQPHRHIKYTGTQESRAPHQYGVYYRHSLVLKRVRSQTLNICNSHRCGGTGGRWQAGLGKQNKNTARTHRERHDTTHTRTPRPAQHDHRHSFKRWWWPWMNPQLHYNYLPVGARPPPPSPPASVRSGSRAPSRARWPAASPARCP